MRVLSDITIGVMGSGQNDYESLAIPVGELLGRLGVNLLTGAGSGVMKSVSRAFTECSIRNVGICIGIVPCDPEYRHRPKPGYPNAYAELAIMTHLPLSGERGKEEGSRNHINILSSAAIIALPGGDGTISEVELALAYDKPLIAYASDLNLLEGFPSGLRRTTNLGEVEAFIQETIRMSRNK
jgi:uncharacterized protein (TIGR00725 family)